MIHLRRLTNGLFALLVIISCIVSGVVALRGLWILFNYHFSDYTYSGLSDYLSIFALLMAALGTSYIIGFDILSDENQETKNT